LREDPQNITPVTNRYGKKSRIVPTEPLVYRSRTILSKGKAEEERSGKEEKRKGSAGECRRRGSIGREETTRTSKKLPRVCPGRSKRTSENPFELSRKPSRRFGIDQDLGTVRFAVSDVPHPGERIVCTQTMRTRHTRSPLPSRRDVIFSGIQTCPRCHFTLYT